MTRSVFRGVVGVAALAKETGLTHLLSQLQTDIDHLVRAVNQLTVENRQLRGALSQPSSPVRALPTQPRPHRIP
ncbi:hypothetical protein [Streptomyces sp. NPDC002172]